jgi:hypothetical protein
MRFNKYEFFQNFSEREDLKKYGDNALLLYSLQIRFGIEDIDDVAATSLTDGGGDKKADLVYINTDRKEAIIAQGYYSSSFKAEAPANKASDLNTAIAWLLARELKDVPKRLKSAAKELRQKINDGDIAKVSLWYSHNSPESHNVEQELKSAESTLSSALKNYFAGKDVECGHLEIGLTTLNRWYTSLTIPILVTDKIEIKNCIGFETSGPDWSSFTTSFPADKLWELYSSYNTLLFSANVRDYLGSRKADSNINNGIKETASTTPEQFFVYNNGITALTNKFEMKNDKLVINGISIVNGAQTTGAIGTLPSKPGSELKIPIRFIKCSNPDTVASIVKYNNSQNKINAPDFRSNDDLQKRITLEFKGLSRIEYSARRGGAVDVIKRNPNLLPSLMAGQVLAAFHGKPGIAYNEKTKIWDNDSLYSQFFNDQTSAKHIFLCYALVKAIEELKFELLQKSELLSNEQELLDFLRSRGSIIVFASAIANSLEVILNKKISNKFSIVFCKNLTLEQAKYEWKQILNMASAFVSTLNEGLEDGIKNEEKINTAIKTFTTLMNAVRVANKSILEKFSSAICV